jgi:hypothetical protein
MVGGLEQARPCLLELRDQGRIERRLDVDHISFPMWERLTIEPPGDDAGVVD